MVSAPVSVDGLAAFTLLWCAQQALLLFYTQLASPFDKLQALLVAAAALSSAWPPALWRGQLPHR